jgi:DNA-binding response OmpR family regulator
MAADTRVDKTAGGPPLIVVVDDDEGVREVCVDGLRDAGYAVAAFARGDDALRAVARVAVAVLVVDWRMPGLDGAEVARRARALAPGLGVLMITGHPGEAAAPARSAGVDRLLTKPFDVAELVSAVTALAEATS